MNFQNYNILNGLWEHLNKFEMNIIMNMEY